MIEDKDLLHRRQENIKEAMIEEETIMDLAQEEVKE
jgi:hypothetical protein